MSTQGINADIMRAVADLLEAVASSAAELNYSTSLVVKGELNITDEWDADVFGVIKRNDDDDWAFFTYNEDA